MDVRDGWIREVLQCERVGNRTRFSGRHGSVIGDNVLTLTTRNKQERT
jgi:hypothetical protein